MKIAAVAALLLAALASRAEECAPSSVDRAFMDSAVQSWTKAWGRGGRLPHIVFFDARCTWEKTGGELRSAAHGGTVRLPDGNGIPARLMSFAGSYGPSATPFMVMAMPALWRAEPRHRDEPDLDRLMRSVFVHEMTHTIQTAALGERLTQIERLHTFDDGFDDDLVQRRFSTRDGYREAYAKERDLLFAVAAASDVSQRRVLAREAVRLSRERRARYFTGNDSFYADVEEIFLGMEGFANWMAYRSVCQEGATPEEARRLIRRDGRWWSQDEGLALFLAVDALMPAGWQEHVTGDRVTPAWTLLAIAAEQR